MTKEDDARFKVLEDRRAGEAIYPNHEKRAIIADVVLAKLMCCRDCGKVGNFLYKHLDLNSFPVHVFRDNDASEKIAEYVELALKERA